MRRPQQDRGFTLVEMLVAVVLASVVGTVLMSVTVSASRAASRQEDQTRTVATAKVAMERLTREIRGANSVTTAKPRELAFVASYGGYRYATTYTVVTTGTTSEIQQVQTRQDLSTGVTSAAVTRKVLSGLAVGRSDAVFTYKDGSGLALTPTSTAPVAYAPGAVKSVGVLVLMKRARGGPPVQLQQVVSIRNFEV